MPVQGYNVIPDENDHEPTIGIEIETTNELFNGKACVYIGEGYGQTEIHLSYNELCSFIAHAKYVRSEMEWNEATYAFASQGIAGDTQHLIVKGNAKLERSPFVIEPTTLKFEHTLCGRPAPVWAHSTDLRGWDISPVIGDDPHCEKVCKRCYAKWQKLQQQSAA